MIIPVKTDSFCYDIVIGQGILKTLPSLIDFTEKTLVVTDSGVPEKYAKTVMNFCKNPVLVTLPEGEKSKNINEFQRILSVMLENEFTRSDSVIAVGGGVVGDISGFAASCYMRGIDFYNVPTTLLSQVDSSIGGKTAIDFGGIKNSVGAFYQPKKVIIDTDVLKTLNCRQLMAGLAESIKMAVTSDEQLFTLIENSTDIYKDLPKIIEASLLIKKSVVENDPKENGLRRVLNFGHTVGHAIEALEQGRLLHGECVALGMLPFCSDAVKKRLLKVLEKYSLPTKITQKDELIPYIKHDKKITKDGIVTVFSDKIGTFEFRKMSAEEIISLL
ncbi:MAG: 3-dehydroquinate synthase [Clostridia bacterium]|nr:3-dehydroquinate synthase [Clostridia bacterium]